MKKSNERNKKKSEKIKTGVAHKRYAGILLHITSLPSSFGIGDFGPNAFAFVDFLKSNHQTYWQILPLTCTEPSQAYSPYSATSSMAGNLLLISPELLVKDKLLNSATIQQCKIVNDGKVNFNEATKIKTTLLNKAYEKFKTANDAKLNIHFNDFLKAEQHWLNDYALYTVIKKEYNQKPWYKWPEKYKLRNTESLNQFASDHEENLVKEKWFQFIFFKQWHALKKYSNNKQVKIFGDLPFYVSYDSADVWANPQYFALNNDGDMTGVAGVPPDYFNTNGQLWGMPVFRWDVLKKNNYDWWITRIRKNLALYDLLRFDHFRAFSSYWDVPAKEKTAIPGNWKEGPGHEFFSVVKKAFHTMPFIAEDLGDIDDNVHQLRDAFNLPGMKVLQFAFGNNMPVSEHIPHNFKSNFVVYTGTHDNNTTRGWLKENKKNAVLQNLKNYFGKTITEKNVHIELTKLAYASTAKIAIIAMQDLLGLDEKSRINTPASTSGNWQWRFKENALEKITCPIKLWTELFNRKG